MFFFFRTQLIPKRSTRAVFSRCCNESIPCFLYQQYFFLFLRLFVFPDIGGNEQLYCVFDFIFFFCYLDIDLEYWSLQVACLHRTLTQHFTGTSPETLKVKYRWSAGPQIDQGISPLGRIHKSWIKSPWNNKYLKQIFLTTLRRSTTTCKSEQRERWMGFSSCTTFRLRIRKLNLEVYYLVTCRILKETRVSPCRVGAILRFYKQCSEQIELTMIISLNRLQVQKCEFCSMGCGKLLSRSTAFSGQHRRTWNWLNCSETVLKGIFVRMQLELEAACPCMYKDTNTLSGVWHMSTFLKDSYHGGNFAAKVKKSRKNHWNCFVGLEQEPVVSTVCCITRQTNHVSGSSGFSPLGHSRG